MRNSKHQQTMNRVRQVVHIVEQTAAHEPYGEQDGFTICVLCGQDMDHENDDELGQHAGGCPYRMASEYVQDMSTSSA